MTNQTPGEASAAKGALAHAGLPREEVEAWVRTAPARTTELTSDRVSFGAFWLRSGELLSRLPPKAKRNPAESTAAQAILELGRASRSRFLRTHARAIY